MKLICGNTYMVREQLKRLPGGARWNAAAKGWEVNDADEAAAWALVNGKPAPIAAPVASLVNWSPEQLAIFEFFKSGTGNAVVQARAGTGKTTTIKEAFGYVADANAEMLYAVFNKKNQVEAAAKISDVRVDTRTLHSVGFSAIKAVWPKSEPDNTVEADRIRASYPGDIEGELVSTVEKLVGFAKNLSITVPTTAEMLRIILDREIFCGITDADGVEKYPADVLAELAIAAMGRALVADERGRVSFNDMVWLPVAKGWVHPKYDLVCVDEAQDMNLPQLEAALRSCRANGRIVVVGDDRQAIYGFRGAASDGMKAMQIRLNAVVLGLTITYRCPKLVVDMAAAIVPDYRAASAAPVGEIRECEVGQLTRQVSPGDAILSRANAPLMGLCLALLRSNVNARIEGRDIGQQLVGMVKKLKARSVPDFFKRLETWAAKQAKRRPLAIDDINDQRDTLMAVADGCASVGEIESRLGRMFSDGDNGRPSVVLSTVHKAKGLEWNRVFILGWTFKSKTEEDHNIYYVAITRTKKVLIDVYEKK